MSRYNKAGHPTSVEIAVLIEQLRDALFREYGLDYAFFVAAERGVVAAAYGDCTVHAVIRDTREDSK